MSVWCSLHEAYGAFGHLNGLWWHGLPLPMFQSPCPGLEGSLTTAAAEYPEAFCDAFASISRDVARSSRESFERQAHTSQAIDEDLRTLRHHRGSRWFVSHLWSAHLAESLPWRVRRAYRFKHPNHINVLESHARKTFWFRRCL